MDATDIAMDIIDQYGIFNELNTELFLAKNCEEIAKLIDSFNIDENGNIKYKNYCEKISEDIEDNMINCKIVTDIIDSLYPLKINYKNEIDMTGVYNNLMSPIILIIKPYFIVLHRPEFKMRQK